MNMREQYEKETGGKPSFKTNPLIETFTHDYVEWLELKIEQLQNTSSNNDYKKLPSLETHIAELEKTGWLHEDEKSIFEEQRRNGVDVVLSVIKRIGNFS